MKTKLFFALVCFSTYSITVLGQNIIQSEDFESYFAGQRLIDKEAVENWCTWDSTAEKSCYVSTEKAYTGIKSIKINDKQDVVYNLGSYTEGEYLIDFYIFIENQKKAYFNVLQEFKGKDSKWGMEVKFNNDGTGNIYFAEQNIDFEFKFEEWLHVEININLDNDFCVFSIDGVELGNGNWSFGTNGKDELLQIDRLTFWGGNGDFPSSFYVDNIKYSKLNRNPIDFNLKVDVSFSPDTCIIITWDVPQNNIPLRYSITKNNRIINTDLKTNKYIDKDILPDKYYNYSVKAYYNGTGYTSNKDYKGVGPILDPVIDIFDFFNTEGITPPSITCIEQDNNGNMWFGTRYNGLLKYDGKDWRIFSVSNSGLPNNSISKIKIDTKNNIWLTFFLEDINDEGDGIVHYNGQTWEVLNRKNGGLPVSLITCITIDSNDIVWAGFVQNVDRGPIKFDKNGLLTSHPEVQFRRGGFLNYDGKNVQIFYVMDNRCSGVDFIECDNNNNIWIGTNRIWQFNDSGTFVQHTINLKNSVDGLLNIITNEISKDNSGNIIAVTHNGMAKFDGNNWYNFNGFDFSEFFDNSWDNYSFCGFTPYRHNGFTTDKNNNIWVFKDQKLVAFRDNKWIEMDLSDVVFQNDDSDFISAIKFIENGKMWLGRKKGLSYYDGTEWYHLNLGHTIIETYYTSIYHDEIYAILGWCQGQNEDIVKECAKQMCIKYGAVNPIEYTTVESSNEYGVFGVKEFDSKVFYRCQFSEKSIQDAHSGINSWRHGFDNSGDGRYIVVGEWEANTEIKGGYNHGNPNYLDYIPCFLVIYFDKTNNALGWCRGIDQNEVNNCALNKCLQYGGSKSTSECIYNANVTALFGAVAMVDDNPYYFNFGASNTSIEEAEQDALNELNKTNGTILASWDANAETSGGYKFGTNSYANNYNNTKKNSGLDNFLDGAQQGLDNYNTQRGHPELTSDNIFNQSGNNNYESSSNTNANTCMKSIKTSPNLFEFYCNTLSYYSQGNIELGGLVNDCNLPIGPLQSIVFKSGCELRFDFEGYVIYGIIAQDVFVRLDCGSGFVKLVGGSEAWFKRKDEVAVVYKGTVAETTYINGSKYNPWSTFSCH